MEPTYFHNVLGNEALISHLQEAIRLNSISHAYLFNGEDGSGKRLITTAFVTALECSSKEEEPCGKCSSCMQMVSGNHPDVTFITHEKSVISVDDIREQLNHLVSIKPYSSPYKVFIIDEAEKMNDQAQNALLKTLEEPPEYAIILLLTNNENSLLETIRSRCVKLDTRPLTKEQIRSYLMEHLSLPDYQADLAASFSCGNLGKALRYAASPDFSDCRDMLLPILRHLDEMTVSEIIAYVKPLAEKKDTLSDVLDLILLWYRDVLLFKASQNANILVYRNELSDINQYANTRSFEALENVISSVEIARQRFKANVSTEVVLELLFLCMKDLQ